MKLLLDTHAALWAWASPGRLSAKVRDAILDPRAAIWVSPVSAYEIALKVNLGKLPALPASFEALAEAAGFDVLELTSLHCTSAGALPLDNRDPWDRILAAQAQCEGLTLASADQSIGCLGVAVVW